MRLSEIIVIYLAAAAPVGVVYFLSRTHAHAPSPRVVTRAAAAALAWPFTLAALWFERRRASARRSPQEARRQGGRRLDEARAEDS
ncbi:MAG TPA: hypothetical protein VGV38_06845, partial [Pyrinomonadaceae bacterium]|nr:hypothetical protein [Pyrinomonadaceae bacterium]